VFQTRVEDDATVDTKSPQGLRPPFTHSPGLITGVQSHGDAIVLSVAGDIGLASAPQLVEVATAILDRRPRALVVDMSRVSFLASAGLAALVDLRRRAGAVTFRVVASTSTVVRPLALAGLDTLIDVRATLADALAEPA
jgi:anti-sigma B factor antagonist